LWTIVIATIFALALVLFPLRMRSSGPTATAQAAAAPGPAASKGAAKKGAKGDAAADVAEGEAGDAGAASPQAGAPPAPEARPPATNLKSIPIGKGLPVQVNVAVFFLELGSFDDTKGEFECTTDMRLRWTDPRLAFDPKETLRGYRELRGKEAEEQFEKLWAPNVDVKNRLETGGYVGRRLRIFPDGRVELITRTTAKYKTTVNPERYPFDRQRLPLELIVREDTADDVLLIFDKDDIDFSRAGPEAKLDGWEPRLVDLTAGAISGWNGDRYSTATATLFVDREAATSIAPVFIPLFASLLIPLLALWMNTATENGFKVDAFELANIGIGGLFSVIALSFAIYSANPIIASGDNTVTRLFALNYAALAVALTIVVVFFRFELPRRLFGIHVQVEAFRFLAWATPLLSMATSIAFLLVAAV
jgi:hypothetical protein